MRKNLEDTQKNSNNIRSNPFFLVLYIVIYVADLAGSQLFMGRRDNRGSSRSISRQYLDERDHVKCLEIGIAACSVVPVLPNTKCSSDEYSTVSSNAYTLAKTDGTIDTVNVRPVRSSILPLWNEIRCWSGHVVNHPITQNAVVVAIVINGIVMGMGTFQFDESILNKIDGIDLAFLIAFTLELTMQLIYHGVYMFCDGWLVFDTIVVLFSWPFSGLSVIRSFRVLRALRLATRVPELRRLILALFAVLPRLVGIATIMGLVFYVYAVLFTSLFQDLYDQGLTSHNYFSRLDRTTFTLFQMMTLDSWSAITLELMEVYPWAWIPSVSYILLSSFIIVNLVIAVICDAVAEVNREEIHKEVEHIKSFSVVSDSSAADTREMKQDMRALTLQMSVLFQENREIKSRLEELILIQSEGKGESKCSSPTLT